MAQPSGFAQPIDALTAVATCLGDFTILDESGSTQLTPQFFIGDRNIGATLDCCTDGKPLLRIESDGENPAGGLPLTLSKHGCIELVMGITVTFVTCFKTINKQGQVVTDATGLAYSTTIMDARWRAIEMFRCCGENSLKYVSSRPIDPDGKCAGFEISLLANLSLCRPCETADSASS